MIEISNTFILVWLVVLAIICMYLLYMSLTRNNESDGLKTTISNLIRQNKKRDELINFLMERVETLTVAVNNLTLQPVKSNTPNIPIQEPGELVDNGNINQPLQTENTTNNNNNTENLTLDDVLNAIPIAQTEPDSDNVVIPPALDSNLLNNSVNAMEFGEFPEEITASEFAGIKTDVINSVDSVSNLNLDEVLDSIPATTFKDDDLISTILGADDSASQTGNDDHTDLPPEKIKLLGMSVKQLKQIAKDMNIKSRGNKTELVDSIWLKLLLTNNTNATITDNAQTNLVVDTEANTANNSCLNTEPANNTLEPEQNNHITTKNQSENNIENNTENNNEKENMNDATVNFPKLVVDETCMLIYDLVGGDKIKNHP